MSDYTPEAGDRVSLSIRQAEVMSTRPGPGGTRYITVRIDDTGANHEFFLAGEGGMVQVEKFSEPLPTNYGAVIESEAGTRYGLGDDLLWWEFGDAYGHYPGSLAGIKFTVIDAGKAAS